MAMIRKVSIMTADNVVSFSDAPYKFNYVTSLRERMYARELAMRHAFFGQYYYVDAYRFAFELTGSDAELASLGDKQIYARAYNLAKKDRIREQFNYWHRIHHNSIVEKMAIWLEYRELMQ